MELSPNRFACQWCAHHFVRPHPTGRKPVYCARACRQRAYEARRRAALVTGYPQPPPMHRSAAPAAYEGGRNGRLLHALRPDGFPARNGYRPGLCGAWAHPVRPSFTYNPLNGPTCRTCSHIADRHPPSRAVDPARDVAVLTTLAGRLRPEIGRLPSAVAQLVAYCWPAR
jgi:hypothetical protein